jgi:chloramphenicol 3-O-phosphotransferase
MTRSGAARPDPAHEISVLVQSRQGLIAIESKDHVRTVRTIVDAASTLGLPVFTWSNTKGIRRHGAVDVDSAVYGTVDAAAALHHVEDASQAAIYVFEGLAPSLEDALVAQRLRDAVQRLSGVSGAIVVLDKAANLPSGVRTLAASVALPPPTASEYRALVSEVYYYLAARMSVTTHLEPETMDRLIAALKGLTLLEAEKVLTRAMVDDGKLDAKDIPGILEFKHAAIKADGLLEFCPVDVTLDDIADLEALKRWLGTRRAVVADPARAAIAGLPFPKGMLLVGVPGCGKSMCAKAVAADWGLPLLKLDTSAIYDKYLGESESRFLAAIRSAEDAGPVVLWIDEIEKAFSSGGDSDGGVSTRILGTFLSWLQERRGDVFVVATANDIAKLPAELVRKGRFDEIFFVDLPIPEVRATIFALNLTKRALDASIFDTSALAEATEGFSGAEIEQVVVSALYAAFAAKSPLTMGGLLAEAQRTRPLSSTMHERISGLREWARERTVSAH